MVCEKCKTELIENSSFCHVCGKTVKTRKQGGVSGINIYNFVMLAIYGISLITCFICNLAIENDLSWFYIVLASIMLSFSITNLPFILKKHRCIISMAVSSVLIYILLFFCCDYVQGDWLFSFAYPIATYSLIFVWVIFIVVMYIKINWGYKTAIILFLSGVLTFSTNPLIIFLLGEEDTLIKSFENYKGNMDYIANQIVFLCLIATSVISYVIGICISLRKRN